MQDRRIERRETFALATKLQMLAEVFVVEIVQVLATVLFPADMQLDLGQLVDLHIQYIYIYSISALMTSDNV